MLVNAWHVTERSAYHLGVEVGEIIASWIHVPEIGTPIRRDIDWVGLEDKVTEENQREYYELTVSQVESSRRSDADAINGYVSTLNGWCDHLEDDSHELWLHFEDGVSRGAMNEYERMTQ